MKFAFVTAEGTSHVFLIDLPILSNAPANTMIRIQLGHTVITELPYKTLSEDLELDVERNILQTGDNVFNVYYIADNQILEQFSFTVSATDEDSVFVSGIKSVLKVSTSRLRVIAQQTKGAVMSVKQRFISLFKQIAGLLSLKPLLRRWNEMRPPDSAEMAFTSIPTYADFLQMKSKNAVISSQGLKVWAKKAIEASVAMLSIGAVMNMFRRGSVGSNTATLADKSLS